MSFIKILKSDLYRMAKKKTTYLIFLTLLVPLIFGIGMYAQISFLVQDGDSSFDVISNQGISALQFTANMMSQSTYVVYLVMIIIASMAVANEFEAGQARLYAVRICSRSKIVTSKLLSLFLLVGGYMVLYSLFSMGIYYLLVGKSQYGNGTLFSEGRNAALYLLVTCVGIMVVIALTLLLGMFLKTFHCFSAAYLIWFIAKYLSFFDGLKLAAPDNCADVILTNGINHMELLKWMGIYVLYIVIAWLVSVCIFRCKDMK